MYHELFSESYFFRYEVSNTLCVNCMTWIECFLIFAVPNGIVTYSRQFLPNNRFPDWINSKSKFPKLSVSSSGTIEDEGFGLFQVDFANKWALLMRKIDKYLSRLIIGDIFLPQICRRWSDWFRLCSRRNQICRLSGIDIITIIYPSFGRKRSARRDRSVILIFI